MYPQMFGKYVLERELARGGMARVLLATLRGAGGFEKRLVVKQIRDDLAFDSEFVRRFVEEAKTTVALSHPNIVPVYELGVEQGTYFLAMELVEGVSVTELLRDAGARVDGGRGLSPEEAAYIGVETCRALDYAHRRMKVVHRDITPRNVMVDEEGQVKIIDFGIAAPARVAGHEVFGSPGHMPPEQVDGEELGPPTDVFALAVLLMEAWSGTPPFRRPTPEECAQAMRAAHPRPSDADPRLAPLDAVIGRAMSLDPSARPKDADDLGRALRGFLSGCDMGDIARALGDRVRITRERAREPPPPASEGPKPDRTSPSFGDIGTKTFAARQEVDRWSSPPPAEAPSTRRLDDGAPPPSTRKLEASGPPGPPHDVPVETIATKPTTGRAPPAAPSPAGSSRTPLYLVAGILLAAGTAYVAGTRTARPTITTPSIATTPTTSTSAPPPLAYSATSSTASAAPSALQTAQIAPAPGTALGVTATARARLSLNGDPGTWVTVDGTSRGRCPAVALVEPGEHRIRFTFDPTRESQETRLTTRGTETITVRADFTGATPTVSVQR